MVSQTSSGPEILPRHVAIIMDGNGRWAVDRGKPRTQGHEVGADAVRATVKACRKRDIPYLTLYAFSVANWARPPHEVQALMRLCAEFAERERDELIENGVRVQVIGDLEELPTTTRRAIESLVTDTQACDKMTLALALSYGGRHDMISAMRQVAVAARAGLLIPEEIDERSVRRWLTTSGLPDPDLVIRTGGEHRLSDFLLFESAYAELFFTDVRWPDFDEAILDEALAGYARRERRYGRTGGQVRARSA